MVALFVGMLGVAFAFNVGGTVQIYVYRILGLDWFGGDVATAMSLFKLLLPLFGLVYAVGTVMVAYDLITLGSRVTAPARVPAYAGATPVYPTTRWARPLTGFEAGSWLLMMWVLGAISTLALLSFNLPRVRVDCDATPPYLLAGVGYTGLLLITLLFVWRFLASREARTRAPENASLPQGLPAQA